ncbi:hypothetical protein O7626_40380 [Micromonospora sp. WMMD1102]|nr:hypothetical protein [Micromonospora sp. WMMD1102]MDG4792076.1 hypothetical protein [Micromonospora sp. WMMD1102]
MSRLFRRPARYVGLHRSGVERLAVPVDPWQAGEAFDPLTDTVLISLF